MQDEQHNLLTKLRHINIFNKWKLQKKIRHDPFSQFPHTDRSRHGVSGPWVGVTYWAWPRHGLADRPARKLHNPIGRSVRSMCYPAFNRTFSVPVRGVPVPKGVRSFISVGYATDPTPNTNP